MFTAPKLSNSHRNNPDGLTALQVRGEIWISDFTVDCPFKYASTCFFWSIRVSVKVYVRNSSLPCLGVIELDVFGRLCAAGQTHPLGLPLWNIRLTHFSTTKEDWGYRRGSEGDNMNIIFWNSGGWHPLQASGWIFNGVGLSTSTRLVPRSGIFGRIHHDGVTLTEIYSNRQVSWCAERGVLLAHTHTHKCIHT